MAIARTIDQPNGLAFGLAWRNLIFTFLRKPEEVIQNYDECLARTQEFPAVFPITEVTQGRAIAQLGQLDEGVSQGNRVNGFTV